MKTQEEKIKGVIVHSLNFMVKDMMQSALILASEDEQWDLQGLQAPDFSSEVDEYNFWCMEKELEVLEQIGDKNVCTMFGTIKIILAYNDAFQTQNGIDYADCIADDEIYHMAENLYVNMCSDIGISYKRRVEDECDMKYFFYLNAWRCVEILSTNCIVIDEAAEKIFNDKIFDYICGSVKSDDQNIKLLLQMMAEIGKIQTGI